MGSDNSQYGTDDKFGNFIKTEVIHQLNRSNIFEHHNNDKNYLKTASEEKRVGGVQAGSKEENFVGVLGGRGYKIFLFTTHLHPPPLPPSLLRPI